MMRIAYIVSRFPKLSETFVYREINELRRQGANVLCFSIHRPEPEPLPPAAAHFRQETTYLWPPHPARFVLSLLHFASIAPARFLQTLQLYWRRVPRHFTGKKRFVLHVLEGAYLAYLCKRRRIDYIHAHFANGPSSVAMAASELSAIPFGFTCHAQDIYADPLLLDLKIERAQIALTISDFNRNYIREKFSLQTPSNLEVHRVALDLTEFRPPRAARANSASPLILTIGRLVPKKGFIHLIRACEILAQQQKAFRCWIVGDGPERAALQTAIAQANLQDRVSLLGAQADVKKFLRQAEVYVQPSVVDNSGDRDGIPTTLMEAMAMQVPVIATNVAGIPELIQHEYHGLVVSPADPAALAQAILRLQVDERLRQTLVANASQHIAKQHNLAVNTKKLLDKIAGVTKKKIEPEICNQETASHFQTSRNLCALLY
jgi:glycosyltransferase involved in cell wall biosynthesis